MKCRQCGFENKKGAKFCTKCGGSLSHAPVETSEKSNSTKYIIIALIAVIILLVGVIGYFALAGDDSSSSADEASQEADVSQAVDSVESDDSDDDVQTQVVSSNQESEAKSWVSIGSYSGEGSGSKTVVVPSGKIMVKLSAYPIKNYATNHLYVSGSNGESGGVDWGSKSAVETRSDSFTYTSSSDETFTIDYYETVSWNVEFYRYQ